MLNAKDILDAKNRIRNYLHHTPISYSTTLNKMLSNHEVFFKLECQQKIGAFKSRGAFNKILYLIEQKQKPKKIVANSSGNHAQAVAWASRQFGIPSTIFMPEYASKIKIFFRKS